MENGKQRPQAFQMLKKYIFDHFNGKLASGGKEIIIRCFLCGDSRDITDAHMYIGISKYNKISYNCFKCNSKGAIDAAFLKRMGCYDTDIIKAVVEFNNTNDNNRYSIKRTPDYNYNIMYNKDLADKKIQYIVNRLGCDNHFLPYNIIPNILDFLYSNGIKTYSRDPRVMEELNLYFVGFLSIDGSHIILRRIIPEGIVHKNIDNRYINYNIYQNKNGVLFYNIPLSVNTFYPIDIHVAEGPFDVLGIYYYNFTKNSIFISCCGLDYFSPVKYLLSKYGFINFNIHFYVDSNVSIDLHSKDLQAFKLIANCITIHRNNYPGEKDYGVPSNMILDTFQII